MRKQSGFTVIELIVVVTILGLLMAVGIPNYLSYLPGWRLRSTARDLYSNLQLAKMAAIKNHTNCTITFSAAGTYTISGAMTKTVDLADYGSGVTFHGPNNETFAVASITFNSRSLVSSTLDATNGGYAFLSNAANTGFYRVGPLISGVIILQQRVGGSWE